MKTLLFDFDGTIADSFEMMLEIAHEITGIPIPDEEEMNRLRALPIPKIMRELHIPLLKVPKLVMQGRHQMHARIGELVPFPGIPEALTSLKTSGFDLYVMSSNSPEGVRAFLRNHDLDGIFDDVYGNVGLFSKATAIHKLLKQKQIEKSDCFYIGDELRDVIAAAQVGVRCVTVAWGYQAASVLHARKSYAFAEVPADLPVIFQKEITNA